MSSSPSTLNFGSMTDVFGFLIEIDKLKSVQRRNKIIGSERHEDSAEHSWHFAVAAMALAPYAGEGVDIQRVIQMALIHDIVEIDAGDVIVYDFPPVWRFTIRKSLPPPAFLACCQSRSASNSTNLWEEYEANETPSAQFAMVLDRVMPMLMNLYNGGQSWVENGIRLEQVLERAEFIADINPELWQYLKQHLEEAKAKGWLL
nr:HD domain-containing protein [Pectobacterium colocasium]